MPWPTFKLDIGFCAESPSHPRQHSVFPREKERERLRAYKQTQAGPDEPELGGGAGVVGRELHLDEDLGLLDPHVARLGGGDGHGVDHEGVLGQVLSQLGVIVKVLQPNVPGGGWDGPSNI
jgi:hypothetical protein